MRRKRSRSAFWIVVLAAAALSLSRKWTEAVPSDEASATGMPDRAELPAPLAGRGERVVEHLRYTVSYDPRTNCPNYVAWRLSADQTEGHVRRDGAEFLPDPQLPGRMRVTTDDYRGSGYDRGHMCPAADNRYEARAMTECFYMSNICPQDHALNAGAWATLEKACRRWAVQEGAVYVVCGPLFGPDPDTIGREHRVAVPDGFFKCVLSLRPGAEKAIGFIYRNDAGRQTMDGAAVTVDEVERVSGIDFFASLPDTLEDRLESVCRLKAWR